MVKRSRTKTPAMKETDRRSVNPPDVPDRRGLQAFSRGKDRQLRRLPQGLVNHVDQGLVNHAAKRLAGEIGLTSIFKPKRTRSG
jgi:hypothetical protein